MSEFPSCIHSREIPMPRVLPTRLCSKLHGEMHSRWLGVGLVLEPAVCEGCPDRVPRPSVAPRAAHEE